MKRAAAMRIILDFCQSSGSAEVRAAVAALEPTGRAKAGDASERGLAFTDWFRTLLPDGVRLERAWRLSWAACYDCMIQQDGRTPEQIAAVCRWARTHDFWKAHFQSPLKLRQRKDGVMYFDRFSESMAGSKPRRPQARGYEIEKGHGPKAVSALDLLKGKTR